MFKELIKNFFNSKEGQSITKAIDLLNLPLISQFRVFQFSGVADGTPLQGNFVDTDIVGRMIVIKGIKVVPYYNTADNIDLYLTDGVDTFSEILATNMRVNRLFDVYDYGVQLSLFINGNKQPMFPSEVALLPNSGDGNIPFDLDIDNIYYKFPQKLTSLEINIDGRLFSDILTLVTPQPSVKVFLQCYLF